MTNMMKVQGRTAVITGAASGIGRAIAISLARRGCNLALADLNEAGLEETARLAGNGVRISRHRLDVSDRAAVAAFPDSVRAAHPGVDILVNNAGVAIGGTFEQVGEADFEWLFEINFWGVVRMTRAFLPLLRASDDARLVNLSSIYGIIAPPGQSAYSASKFAVRGFSQALRHELEGTHIGVTVVHPGGVATSIAKNARAPKDVPAEEVERRRAESDKMLTLPPEKAGEIIVTGIERRQARVLVGNDAKIVSVIERLKPVTYWKLLEKMRPKA
ncbi:SDR family NAD(P)-dependent oxidoreductase [Indioceanicola profundi]|uniref:SDR family NAD(P)-dependent oxidoreductase n=1 Tax=Indioceanicola profundi TaxID=2220096 RepID=UPI0019693BB0|nr:SDR family oxidoreductase [Indioceanicola profundi]